MSAGSTVVAALELETQRRRDIEEALCLLACRLDSLISEREVVRMRSSQWG